MCAPVMCLSKTKQTNYTHTHFLSTSHIKKVQARVSHRCTECDIDVSDTCLASNCSPGDKTMCMYFSSTNRVAIYHGFCDALQICEL